MIAADPDQGGATWAVLQYLLGFRRLGHRVIFVESIPEASLSPQGVPLDRTRNAGYFRRVMEDIRFRFGFRPPGRGDAADRRPLL